MKVEAPFCPTAAPKAQHNQVKKKKVSFPTFFAPIIDGPKMSLYSE